MKNKILTVLITLLIVPSVVFGMNDLKKVDLTEDYIQDNRKEIVTTMLELTEEQSTAFWPIYEKYREEMNILNENTAKTIKKYMENYEDLGDDTAIEILNGYIDDEEDRMIYKKLYMSRFMEVIPPKKVALLFQMENKMAAVLRFGLAAEIPLIKATEEGIIDFHLGIECLSKE